MAKKIIKEKTTKKQAGAEQRNVEQTRTKQGNGRQIISTAFDALDLVTSAELLNRDNGGIPVYHFIYGSQLYGTLFGVYGRFEGTVITSGEKKTYQVTSVDLKLLNYKGALNIGFTGDFEWKGAKQNLFFGIQGANPTIDISYTFPQPLLVDEGTRYRLIFTRELHALPDFRRFVDQRRGDNRPNQLREEPPVTALFDSEFNERDGVDFYNRELRDGMDGFTPNRFASPRCIQSIVNLHY